jgi:hypothetical protein
VRLSPGNGSLRLAAQDLQAEGPSSAGLQLSLPTSQTVQELVPLISAL